MPPPINPAPSRLGLENVILHARARFHQVREFPGPLSLKSVLGGSVTWWCGRSPYRLTAASCLLLGDGQPYSLEIEEALPVETFCVFFQHGFVEDVHRTMTVPEAATLDQPAVTRRLSFEPELWPAGEGVSQRLAAAARHGLSEDGMVALAEEIARTREKAMLQVAQLPGSRPATREELAKRLARGRQYLHACFDAPAASAHAAREACLSPYHFHRAFRSLHGCTPHSYVTELRMQHARALLAAGHPATEACLQTGYSSLPTFTHQFKRRFGVTPGAVKFRKIR
ncbi:MAG TPA: hypothetical protein DEH78_17935 [Solibacterales bacterium]|nr:hypothetical protein [Bryobacterales bacterium]